MKAWLLKVNDRQRQIVAAVIAILLVAVSLVTTGLTSALCDLSAFVILVGVLWLKMKIVYINIFIDINFNKV
jgi:hypothetical protein